MTYLSGQEPHLLAYLLASSETFANECSTHHGCSTDVSDVVQYVHVPSAEALPFEDGGEGATFPWGIICDESSTHDYVRDGIGDWKASGDLKLSIDLICPIDLHGDLYKSQHLWFVKTTGQIINDMINLVESRVLGPEIDGVQYGTHLNCVQFTRVGSAPFELDPDEELIYRLDSEVPARIWHDEFIVRYF